MSALHAFAHARSAARLFVCQPTLPHAMLARPRVSFGALTLFKVKRAIRWAANAQGKWPDAKTEERRKRRGEKPENRDLSSWRASRERSTAASNRRPRHVIHLAVERPLGPSDSLKAILHRKSSSINLSRSRGCATYHLAVPCGRTPKLYHDSTSTSGVPIHIRQMVNIVSASQVEL